MGSVPQEHIHSSDSIENISKWSRDIDGVFMPKRFLDIQNVVSNWEVNEDDIWIVSFPKTGTTWTQEMVWLLVNNLNYKGAERNLLKRSPQLEATAMVKSSFKLFSPIIPKFITNSLKYVKSQKSPACIKTHLPWNLLPKEIQKEIKKPKLRLIDSISRKNNNGNLDLMMRRGLYPQINYIGNLLPKEIQKEIKKPKIIYISRNPKDTCVSYYHFSRLIKDFDGSLEEFCSSFLAGRVNFAPFWNHVLPFWKRKDHSNILFLKYEEMKQDLPGVIRKTAEFLGKKLTEEEIDKLTHHLSFESMKKNNAVNYDWLVKLSKIYKPDKHGTFMREGKVGGYKEAMTPDMIHRFDKWTEENTRDTGLTYP